MSRPLITALFFSVLAGGIPAAQAAGNPVRGESLHQDCLGCHGTELYVAPRAKAKTLAVLKKETLRWNDRMNPKFTAQEVDDIVAWLNRDFYKFAK